MSPCRPLGTRWLVRAMVLCLGATPIAGAAGAATVTWTNASGGSWSTGANWSTGSAPGAGDTAVLPALSGAYQVTLDTNPSLAALQIAAGDPTLDLAGHSLASIASTDNAGTIANYRGAYLGSLHNTGTVRCAAGDEIVVSGTLNNAGTIVIGAGASLRSTGAAYIDGGGVLDLAGGTIHGPNSDNVPSDMLWVREGSTLAGGGSVRMYINNLGTVDASANLGVDGLVYNWGTIRVSHHATFNVNRPLFKSFGGTIVAGPDGGRFQLAMPAGAMGSMDMLNGGTIVNDGGDLTIRALGIFGGEIQRASTGVVNLEMGNPQDLTVAAGAEVVVTVLMDLTVNGSKLRNHGTVRVPGVIQIGGTDTNTLAFSGDGEVVLDGGTITSPVGAVLINEAGHTIRGCGTISANLYNLGTVESDCGNGLLKIAAPRVVNRRTMLSRRGSLYITGATTKIVNAGTVGTDGGNLWLGAGATIDNSGGRGIVQHRGGQMVFGMRGAGTIVGGYLQGRGVIESRGVTLTNVAITKGTEIVTGSGATTRLTGEKFSTVGTMRIAAGGTVAIDRATEYVQSAGATILEGGRITATRDIRIEGGWLRGAGTIAGNVVNGGTVAPSLGRARLVIEGNYRQLPTGTLNVALAGVDPEQVSRMRVTGDVTLDGALSATAVGAFRPALGQSFDVLGYRTASGKVGDCRVAGADATLAFQTVDAGDHLVLESFQPALPVDDGQRAPSVLRFFGARSAAGTSFVLELPEAAAVSVKVYDAAGRLVSTLAQGAREAGTYAFGLGRAERLASGMYFARLELKGAAGTTTRTARAVVVD